MLTTNLKKKKRILTISIDGKRPNLALAKVKTYYERRGFEVVEDYKRLTQKVDKIYISCLFSWNRHKVEHWLKSNCPVIVGGSGWDIDSRLPDEIEKIRPRINYGYTSRGCVRRCPWCLVWKKEKGFRVVGSLLDLWDGHSKDITLLDNNILADEKHFHSVAWDAHSFGIRLHFYQGLDYRFLNKTVARTLSQIRHKRLRFSFDQPTDYSGVDRGISLLIGEGIKVSQWFVLVGFNTSLKQDIERIDFLRRRGQLVYLARYNFTRDRAYIPLARWCAIPKYFTTLSFKDFLNLPENRKFLEYWKSSLPNH